MNVLLVAEGSGGHVIPALQVARTLASRGARIKVWYAARPHTEPLMAALAGQAGGASIDVDPIPLERQTNWLGRLRQARRLWRQAQRCFDTFAPDVVVGFGGWVSAPVVLAAKQRRIHCLVHEQNVELGRANRWLTRWVDRVAVSFEETGQALRDTPRRSVHAVTTGLPIRQAIGSVSRATAAARFSFAPDRPTLVVFGGSQGARAVNRLMAGVAHALTPEERRSWQILHVSGSADEAMMRDTYARAGLHAWTAPFLIEMEVAYALADVVVARAGASTIAELIRCGVPPVLIPYPHAGGHQRANARMVGAAFGGIVLEEAEATPQRVLEAVRRLMGDPDLRRRMSLQLRTLEHGDASQRLSDAILEAAHR
ncbi:MAG: UDP-N-acetylglucosamine--N-acetylmuramyl-(pentapeptide) pyrophosphoryl-undecaprenol N-acetylglucosamine transferase [Candidatus Omnitrophica bacterium]|nr:UDP-N-acetylglucosamine--N-acetylmuramyl-(pentapeptide) pyrophosphoryl-undecaprenol N-acetylglucosamine transferase [Candidatus Omnitrophota bacterium]